jgi:uncharacterized membrane protein
MPLPDVIVFALAFAAALGSGIMGGLFFAFSTFIMRALAALPPAQGMAAMQSINRVIITPLFLGVFLGVALLSAGLAIHAILRWQASSSSWLLSGSLLYLGGCLVVTMLCNVPRNNQLDSTSPDTPDGVQIWKNYLNGWTKWNHVRTVATLAASATFVIGLCRLSPPA